MCVRRLIVAIDSVSSCWRNVVNVVVFIAVAVIVDVVDLRQDGRHQDQTLPEFCAKKTAANKTVGHVAAGERVAVCEKTAQRETRLHRQLNNWSNVAALLNVVVVVDVGVVWASGRLSRAAVACLSLEITRISIPGPFRSESQDWGKIWSRAKKRKFSAASCFFHLKSRKKN